MSPTYLAVASTDADFMSRLIDFLDKEPCKADSTLVRVHDMDPYEELDLRLAQIEGMTVRIQDLERKYYASNSYSNPSM
jgi:hypothetical protein